MKILLVTNKVHSNKTSLFHGCVFHIWDAHLNDIQVSGTANRMEVGNHHILFLKSRTLEGKNISATQKFCGEIINSWKTAFIMEMLTDLSGEHFDATLLFSHLSYRLKANSNKMSFWLTFIITCKNENRPVLTSCELQEQQGGAISHSKSDAAALPKQPLHQPRGSLSLTASFMSARAFAAQHAFPTCYILMIWENRYQS